jgi:hypothetical protein
MRKSVLVLTACLATSLVACSSEEPAASPTPKPEQTTPLPSAEPTPEETEQAPPASTEEIAVDEVLTDDVFKQHYKVISYIPSLPIPEDFDIEKWGVYDGATVLAMQVELSVDADTEYSKMAFGDDLNLYGTDGNDIPAQSASILMEEAYADEYPLVEDASAGETTTGWVAFIIIDSTGTAPYTVKVERREAQVLGTDQVIPAAEFSFVLPAA